MTPERYPTCPTSKTDRMPTVKRRDCIDHGFLEDYQDHPMVPCWPIDHHAVPWRIVLTSALAGGALGALAVLAVM